MPKSKRAKVVSLTKTSKKTREDKENLVKEIQVNVDKWRYLWLFELGQMRNTHLKAVRDLWKNSARIIFGRRAVMMKALGATPEEEYQSGLHKMSKLNGQVGLLFTDSEPDEVIEWFGDFQRPDFARQGNQAARTVLLPSGPIYQKHSEPPEPFPHSEEPQLRKLGLTTKLERGVPSLSVPHTVCKEGDTLSSEQAQLLKLLGEKMVTFRVNLLARWDSKTSVCTVLAQPSEPSAEDQMSD